MAKNKAEISSLRKLMVNMDKCGQYARLFEEGLAKIEPKLEESDGTIRHLIERPSFRSYPARSKRVLKGSAETMNRIQCLVQEIRNEIGILLEGLDDEAEKISDAVSS